MNWKPMPLIRTPEVFPGESPIGYLLRLSNENGFHGIGRLLPLLGVHHDYVITMGWDFGPLRALLGARSLPDGFGYRLGANARGTINLQGHAIASEHVGFRTARVCPSCLAESAHVRGEWDLKAYVACHRHGCMMLKCCEGCGRRVSAFRNSLTHCNCGTDLRTARPVPAPDVLLALTEVLHAKVTETGEDLRYAVAAQFPHEALLAMDLDTFCKVLVQLTSVLYQMDTGHRPHRKLLRVSELLPRASAVLSCWPESFKSLCVDWRAFSEKTRKKGLYKFQACFDWLFVRLHKNLRSKSRQTLFLLQAALEFAMETWDLAPVQIRGSQLRSLDLPSPRFASTNYAAKIIGIRPSILKSRVTAGKIPGRRTHQGSSRSLFVVDMEAVKSMRFSRFDDVPMPRALRMLGISTAIYRTLRRDGDIPSEHVVTRPGGLAMEDLVAFRSSIVGLARKATGKRGLHSLGDFLEGPTPAYVKIEFLRRIRRGDIEVYFRRRKATFKDLFTIEDLVTASRTSRMPTYGSDDMTMRDVQNAFGLNTYEASAVVCHLTKDDKTKLRPRVKRDDVELFFTRYRPLRLVAEANGVSAPTIHAIAARTEWREYVLTLCHREKARPSLSAYFVARDFEKKARTAVKRLVCPHTRCIAKGKAQQT